MPIHHRNCVLTINAGSTSLRLDAYVLTDEPKHIATARYADAPVPDREILKAFVEEHVLPTPDMVMHRVVHGGDSLIEPCVVNASVTEEITRLTTLSPLHNAVALDWMEAARAAFSNDVAQGACFDTALYRDLPDVAAQYALPQELAEGYGIRRYGFHGLAHQSLLERWRAHSASLGDQRVISLQLGGGCSVTATDHGRPVQTSMGFSPLEGLMMGTRVGNVDAAAVLYLIEEGGFSASEVGRLFNQSSGLLGVSGESADMRALLDSESDAAQLAIEMFCHQLRFYIGAYLAILGGADAIVFGGGIGEHAADIRARALDHLAFAGIHLDTERNAALSPKIGGPIHSEDSRVEIWVVPTDEGQVMARAAQELLNQTAESITAKDHQ